MNFPSVLVAFWSNFGWASGMIYSKSMQESINQFVGSDRGNVSMVGSALSGQNAVNLGGGYSASMIYKRALGSQNLNRLFSTPLQKRSLVNQTPGFTWYGTPVASGLPLPGNFSSFAGTLAELNIPASNAFLTGVLWFLMRDCKPEGVCSRSKVELLRSRVLQLALCRLAPYGKLVTLLLDLTLGAPEAALSRTCWLISTGNFDSLSTTIFSLSIPSSSILVSLRTEVIEKYGSFSSSVVAGWGCVMRLGIGSSVAFFLFNVLEVFGPRAGQISWVEIFSVSLDGHVARNCSNNHSNHHEND